MATKSSSGRTVNINVGIWYAEEDEHIRIRVEGKGLTSVSSDPNSERHHRTLYKKLAEILREHDAWPTETESSEDA